MSDTSEADRDERLEAHDPELIPAAMVRKYAYCPRLFYLEYVHGEWADTEDTVQGELVHGRVDQEQGRLPGPQALAEGIEVSARSVTLSAPMLGVTARIDLLEGTNGEVHPVDYKKGAPGPEGPREPEKLQLCLQGLVLRENGYRCDRGFIYYAEMRRRVEVEFNNALESRTREVLNEMRRTALEPVPPPPLVDSPKCPRCALVGICLPDEVAVLRGEPLGEVRRLMPARDDCAPLYVVEQGARVTARGERLIVKRSGGEEVPVRLIDLSHVSLFGNVQVTAQAVRRLAERDIPIFHHSYAGWLQAITYGLPHRNLEVRISQFRRADDAAFALGLAQAFVTGKLRNQRTLVRRNHPEPHVTVRQLNRFMVAVKGGRSLDDLLGVEGGAARVYFRAFAGMLRNPMGFDVAGRTRRPPSDPVNAVLSFLYTLLVKDVVHALLGVGLDPHRGFYHRVRYGRPSLALDLAEEFRPLIADSVTLGLFNRGTLGPRDFVQRGPGCALKEGARKRVVYAYEQRMDTLIRHPIFGYRVSYRRVISVQARLLARVILGELHDYRPFTTR